LRLTVSLLEPSGAAAAAEVLEWPVQRRDGL
jgi:hypothetical protein